MLFNTHMSKAGEGDADCTSYVLYFKVMIYFITKNFQQTAAEQ